MTQEGGVLKVDVSWWTVGQTLYKVKEVLLKSQRRQCTVYGNSLWLFLSNTVSYSWKSIIIKYNVSHNVWVNVFLVEFAFSSQLCMEFLQFQKYSKYILYVKPLQFCMSYLWLLNYGCPFVEVGDLVKNFLRCALGTVWVMFLTPRNTNGLFVGLLVDITIPPYIFVTFKKIFSMTMH